MFDEDSGIQPAARSRPVTTAARRHLSNQGEITLPAARGRSTLGLLRVGRV
jgi:hypothetical protein